MKYHGRSPLSFVQAAFWVAAAFAVVACAFGGALGSQPTPMLAATPTLAPALTSTTAPSLTPEPTVTYTPRPIPTATSDQRIMYPSNGHFYLYVRQVKTWHAARDHCVVLGGHLVTIETAFENRFVYKLGSSREEGTWLGATDEVQEGTWVWVTEEPIRYWNWPRGNWGDLAGGGGAKDFLIFGDDGTWDDWSADNTAYFVCEWEPTSP